MGCPQLEDLLGEGREGHAAHCEECRALLDALSHVDATFDRAFAGISAPPGLAADLCARAARALPEYGPSLVPEVLDLIGWAAVLAVVAIVLPRFVVLLIPVLAGLG